MGDDLTATIQALVAERDELKGHCQRLQKTMAQVVYPPGHFYSPLVDTSDIALIRALEERRTAPIPGGIRLDADRLRYMLTRLASYRDRFPFPRDQSPPYHYYFNNPFFGCHDGSVYFSMLMEFKPQRVTEIGCGFTSCLLMDTNSHFFRNCIKVTLIDPAIDASPIQLASLAEGAQASLFRCKAQEVGLHLFDQLELKIFYSSTRPT